MKVLYFLKWPFIIFLAGFLIQFVGGLFKIRHWPMADELITIGSLIGIVGIVSGIVKIVFLKKPE